MLFSHIISSRVEYVQTDKMQVMHNSQYFLYFEKGRTETMRQLAISYKEIEEKGIIMPLIEQHCKYILPAYYDDVLLIETIIDEIPYSKFSFQYNIYREEKGGERTLISTGWNTLAFVSKSNNKPVRCPMWILELLNKKLGTK
ncbi:MAG: acyl-CoA thioesterase [Bacteroidales bacterium]|jgi:acyl-CoA thioester hydrolase|nr:acyl-CoA thioesterase [Bacteroidales bacterium]